MAYAAAHEGSRSNSPGNIRDDDTSPLKERRKVLAQVAFVRHSTSELALQLHLSESPKTPRGSTANEQSSRLPGSLYNHHLDKSSAKGSSPNALPQICLSLSLPSTQDLSFQEANLNGIGHPVVLRNHRSASGSRPIAELLGPSHTSDHITQLLQGNHGPTRSRQRSKLPLLHASKGSTGDSNNAEQEASRPTLKRIDTLPRASKELIVRNIPVAKPLGQDTLNLWKGKRLTRLEMKVEQKLHVVRNNPVAKTDLQSRVHGYIEAKAQEQAERVALAELAAERREQRTLEFVGNRLRTSNKAAAPGQMAGANEASSTSLFYSTGQPRDDCNLMPEGSQRFWMGFLALAQKLGQLREQLMLRAEERREENLARQAAVTIQKFWRGFRARNKVNEMKNVLNPSAAPVTGRMQQEAATKVLAFLTYSHNIAILGYLRRRIRERKAAQTLGNVASAFLTAENIRSFRVQILISQWQQVEVRCIELAKKRMRSNIIGEIADLPQRTSITGLPQRTSIGGMTQRTSIGGDARNKSMSNSSALTPLVADKRNRATGRGGESDSDSSMKSMVADALSKTFSTDRVLLEDLRAVPRPVKLATLQMYMQDRLNAYTAQLGIYWKKRARFLIESRAANIKALALTAMDNFQSAPQEGILEEVQQVQMQETTEGLEKDPGPFPRYRALVTLPELKAIMQQGVAETPFFRSYMMRQRLQSYEQELTEELTQRYSVHDEDKLKEIKRRSKQVKVKSSFAHQDSIKAPVDAKSNEKSRSFTLALLLHRWHTESNTRIQACLRRRFELSNLNLVTQLMHGKWISHDEMGAKLMELRDG